MMNKTKLKINRVVVRKLGSNVYDQKFHSGMNVIRGDNSTGKSTIMELISYGLGGDIKKNHWKKEALSCDEIYIDLDINKINYVFKRSIEGEANKPPIHIYEGGYEKASKTLDGWTIYKYRKSDDRKSFAMQIFDLLGYEQHGTSDGESLTVHQLLRLMYVDQDTPASNIFRLESFQYDKDSMRLAIGEFLFGFDDLEAHTIRQRLYVAEKEFDSLDDELKAVYKILGRTNINARTIEINNEIYKLNEDLKKISVQRSELKKSNINSASKELETEAKAINAEIESVSISISALEEELISLTYDQSENEEFLSSLEERKTAIKQSQVTINSLGMIDFEYCPSCLTKIDHETKENHCNLCTSELDSDAINESYIQAMNELDFQYSETTNIIKKQKEEKIALSSKLRSLKDNLERLRSSFNELNTYTDDYELSLTNLASRKGFIESQIETLKDKLNLAAELDAKIELKSQLQAKITTLSNKLESLEAMNARRKKKIYGDISDLVVSILSEDIGTEKDFISAKKFNFDFAPNSILLDGRANFSASSNVLLKNAFHLAVLIIATKDDRFRLPCFTMFDNIEDKGMTEERSRNFQKIMLEKTKDLTDELQIILTTSMVDESLNNEKYGVGPFYPKGEHTLAV